MTQLSTGALWSSFRLVLDLENRSQQIDAAVAHLKTALTDPATMSLPETVGIADDLRWHLDHSLRHLLELEDAVGVTRRGKKRKAKSPRKRPPGYSLRGTTRSVSLPDLIGLLSAQRKTGSLWIKSGSERFILELLEGAIVHAMSDAPRPSSERLGTVLVARNKLSTEKLEEFLQRYCPEDGKIGEVMTRTQLVSEDDLRDALEWQVRELFHRVASIDDAVFSFREGAISKLELRVSLNTTQLLLESAQALDEKAWEQSRTARDADQDSDPDLDADEHVSARETPAEAPPAPVDGVANTADDTPAAAVAAVLTRGTGDAPQAHDGKDEATRAEAHEPERRKSGRRRSKRRRGKS